MLCGVVAGSISGCSDDEPALVIPVDRAAPEPLGGAVRTGVVKVEPSVILDDDSQPESAGDVTLKFFDDVTYDTDLTYAEENGVEQWTGVLTGVKDSTVLVTRSGSAYRIGAISPEGVFQVAARPDGTYVVSQMEYTKQEEFDEVG